MKYSLLGMYDNEQERAGGEQGWARSRESAVSTDQTWLRSSIGCRTDDTVIAVSVMSFFRLLIVCFAIKNVVILFWLLIDYMGNQIRQGNLMLLLFVGRY